MRGPPGRPAPACAGGCAPPPPPLIRQAEPRDAPGTAAVQRVIREARGQEAVSAEHVRIHYVEHPERVSCAVARGPEEVVLGFQSLRRVGPGNPYDVPRGGGVIGTHSHLRAHRLGLGRALFAVALAEAWAAGIATIDATIGTAMPAALAYHEAMGFRTWRRIGGAVGKRLDLRGPPTAVAPTAAAGGSR